MPVNKGEKSKTESVYLPNKPPLSCQLGGNPRDYGDCGDLADGDLPDGDLRNSERDGWLLDSTKIMSLDKKVSTDTTMPPILDKKGEGGGL